MRFALLLFALNIGLFSSLLFGGDLPKFGKIDQSELTMTSIADDPEADAVILFNVGDMRIMDDFVMVMKRHVRIKILTEKGIEEFSDHVIRYYKEDKIRDFKAHTVLPNSKKIKLDKKAVFDEKSGSWYNKKFAMPGVEVGSIIEIKYELSSQYLTYLEPWYFQGPAFTKRSQISVVIKPGFAYNVFFSNTVGVEPSEEDFIEPGRKMTKYTWRMNDLPPIRTEPYMRALEDYRISLHFQMQYYKDPYNYVKFIDDWPSLVKNYWTEIKPFTVANNAIKEKVAELHAGLGADAGEEKVSAIYGFVRDNIVTASGNSYFPKEKPGKVLNEKSGSPADKNLLLVTMLKAAGIDSWPVLISTRDNGMVYKSVPRMSKFNRVLVYAKSGIKTYVMDTRSKNCPFKLLPSQDLVEEGMLIDDKEGRWLKIPQPRNLNMLYCNIDGSLSAEGDLTAKADLRYEGYQGYTMRNALDKKEDLEAYIAGIIEGRFGTSEVDSFKFSGEKAIDEPLRLTINFKVPEYAQATGEMMYFSMPTYNRIKENPFQRENRFSPIEYPYKAMSTDDIKITLPEGMQIKEMPQPIVNRKKTMSYVYNISAEGNVVKLQRQMLRRKQVFAPNEYGAYRSYISRMIESDKAQVVAAISAELGESE